MSLIRSFKIDRTSEIAFAQQIVEHYTAAIQSGGLGFGSKLPSIRVLSKSLEINKIAIINAFEQLTIAGYIQSRPGSGYYVIYKGASKTTSDFLKPLPLTEPTTAISDQLNTDKLPYTFAAAPIRDLKGAVRTVLNKIERGQPIFKSDDSAGLSTLRQEIAQELLYKGITWINRDSVVMTQGSTHALSLLLDCLTQVGDGVLVEVPSPPQFFSVIASKNRVIVPLQRNITGIASADEVEEIFQKNCIKIIIVQSSIHNPMGNGIPLLQKQMLLRIAHKYCCYLIEDDTYGSMQFKDIHIPTFAALDDLKNTFYISSFNQNNILGMKIGFLAGPQIIVEKVNTIKREQGHFTSELDQLVLLEWHQTGLLKKYQKKVISEYIKKCNNFLDILKKIAPQQSQWTIPEGGMFIWFSFAKSIDVQVIYNRIQSINNKILLSNGSDFYPLNSNHKETSRHIRMNFATFEGHQTQPILRQLFEDF